MGGGPHRGVERFTMGRVMLASACQHLGLRHVVCCSLRLHQLGIVGELAMFRQLRLK
jgi:hypothetical protein